MNPNLANPEDGTPLRLSSTQKNGSGSIRSWPLYQAGSVKPAYVLYEHVYNLTVMYSRYDYVFSTLTVMYMRYCHALILQARALLDAPSVYRWIAVICYSSFTASCFNLAAPCCILPALPALLRARPHHSVSEGCSPTSRTLQSQNFAASSLSLARAETGAIFFR